MTEDKAVDDIALMEKRYKDECRAHELTKQNLAYTEQSLAFTLQLFLKVSREFTALGKVLNTSGTQLFQTADLITASYNQIAKELENRQKQQDQQQSPSPEPKKGEISP